MKKRWYALIGLWTGFTLVGLIRDFHKGRAHMMGFGSQEEWERFNHNFPVFVEKYDGLETMRDRIFQRSGVGTPLDRVIFGMGRVCTEDFQQALILCGNSFGIGAMQLIRGMYERLVTAAYLVKHPERVDDYLDFHFIQQHKGLYHLSRAYNDDELNKLVPKEQQEQIKKSYETASKGGRFTANSWSKLSLADMAADAAPGLAAFYFHNYFRPTMFSHSSVHSLLARLRENDKGEMTFDNEGQRKHVREGLIGAHILLLQVFEMQNDYFELGFDDDLKSLGADYLKCWKGYEPPKEV